MIGNLSKRYESNGDPGCVSSGENDAGGVSYGCYQLATNVGSAQSFVGWLGETGSVYYGQLSQYEPGTDEFSQAWREIAANDPDGFEATQHDYIQYAYYEPAISLLAEAGFNIDKHSKTMADVTWSRSVQYGCGLIVEMFEQACHALGHANLSYVDDIHFDNVMIREIYMAVCSTEEWTNGSPDLREGLYNRFSSECYDALNLLSQEGY